MEIPITIQFCSCDFSYDWKKDLDGTYRIRFLMKNSATSQIELRNFSLLGRDDEKNYAYPFTTAKFLFPKQLNASDSEFIWMILTDKAFYKLSTYKMLYLVTEISLNGEVKNLIMKITSNDWENHWTISSEKIVGELNDYRDMSNALDVRSLEDTVRVKIVESTYQTLRFGENDRNAFTFLINIENRSAEDQLFKYDEFLLYDEDSVQLPFANYLSGYSPSDTPLKPGISDRICAVFPSEKTTKEDGRLTLRFKIVPNDCDFSLKETFEFDKIAGVAKEVQHQFEMIKLTPVEKKKDMEEHLRKDEDEKAKRLSSKFNEEFQKAARKYDIGFSKITVIRNSDGTVLLRGLKRDRGISHYCLELAISIIDKYDLIADMKSIRIHEGETNWIAFEIKFDNVPIHRVETVAVTLKD